MEKYLNITSFEATDPHRVTDPEIIFIFHRVLYSVVCQVVDVFGICTNIINIICFVKQGFKEPINVSLLGLAVSDLGCLTTLVWTNICFTPDFTNSDLPFIPSEFQFLTGALPHFTFCRITAWITAFITMERCVCITAPLQVKRIVTTTRVSIFVCCVYVILISSVAPMYVVYSFDLKWVPERNKSLLGLVYQDDRQLVERVSYATNNIAVPASAFIIIIVCTTILTIKLHKTTKWRKTLTSAAITDSVCKRNQKVAKMVVMISTLFIVCFIPVTAIFLAMSLEPTFSIDGKERNTFILVGGVGVLMESINSSMNIFIYYHMSSKFKREFYQLFSTTSYNSRFNYRGKSKVNHKYVTKLDKCWVCVTENKRR